MILVIPLNEKRLTPFTTHSALFSAESRFCLTACPRHCFYHHRGAPFFQLWFMGNREALNHGNEYA